MISWIETHGFEALVMYYLFSAVTGGMPTPAQDASVTYRWVFSTFSLLNASVARLVATQFSQSKVGMALNAPQPVENPTPAEVAKAQGEPPKNG